MTDLSAQYLKMLAEYVKAGEEDQLAGAYFLGRRAFAEGITILELLETHRQATEAVMGRRAPTFPFLAEALATFEMARRGYVEAHERARLEHEQSVMLQENLLPAAVPSVAGLDIAVRYRPGPADSRAGGDWYDAFALETDRLGLVVGDVTGHGVTAAAAMGQLRMAVLAYARAGYEPAQVVERVDALLGWLDREEVSDPAHLTRVATLVYIEANPADGQVVLVNAGHPPPLLVAPDGSARALRGGHGRLLGVNPSVPRQPEQLRLPPAGHLVLYTDGLIESVERAQHDGVARLCEVVEGFSGDAERLCDHILGRMVPESHDDDICILAATLRA